MRHSKVPKILKIWPVLILNSNLGTALWDEIQKSGQNPKFENSKTCKYIHANDT